MKHSFVRIMTIGLALFCNSQLSRAQQRTVLVGAFAEAGQPRVFALDAAVLAKNRDSLRKSGGPPAPAFEKLTKDADKALRAGPYSVTEKTQAPPSGDKHDYFSLSRYSWPDPSKPDGLPYITRDGEVNPEIDAIPDKKNMGRMVSAVNTLAIAYYFTGKEKYATHAALLLRTWFLDDKTRMNPNVTYAQLVKGRPLKPGNAGAIIDTTELVTVTDAAGLLAGSPAWTEADERGLKEWFGRYLDWELTSPYGIHEAETVNNHATWYATQVVAMALYVDRHEVVEKMLTEFRDKRLAAQIETDGSQPLELKRTRSWSYSVYNLQAWFRLAALAHSAGVDLWHHSTSDGRSLRKALDYLVPYARGEKQWEDKQITKLDPKDLAPTLLVGAAEYRDPAYEALARQIAGAEASSADRLHLLLPTRK